MLPLLQAEVVPPGWVTNEEFVAGLLNQDSTRALRALTIFVRAPILWAQIEAVSDKSRPFRKGGWKRRSAAIVIVADLIASNVTLSQGWTTGGEPQ